MQVKILSEHGYEEALFGLGLSYGLTSGLTFEQFKDMPELQERIHGIAVKQAPKGNGHNKFLYQMGVVLDLDLPRYMWPEFDQYKVATVTQSESTMHTIHKKEFSLDDFELDVGVDYTMQDQINALNKARERYQKYIGFGSIAKERAKSTWREIIQLLPQSYLQRRIWTGNYANLRNTIIQRTGHKLSEWAVFIDAIRSQCAHPEFLP